MGISNGHWEGDTLVVEVTGLNGQSWFDRAGNFASENVRIVERYALDDPDHLNYEATIDDKTVFTRPWKISLPLYRRKGNECTTDGIQMCRIHRRNAVWASA
jgi:hypothetical protein